MPEDMTLEEVVEQFLKTRDEWEEAWEQLFIRRGYDQAQQEARQKLDKYEGRLGFLLDDWIGDDTISDPRD